MTSISLNTAERLFVFKNPGYVSCLGFDVVFKRFTQYARVLGLQPPRQEQVGTLEQLKGYLKAEQAFAQARPQDTVYDPETSEKVREVLEGYRKSGKKIRVFLGDPETGRAWLGDADVFGTVSRSTGPIKIPLLVSPGDSGGSALLTANILRIIDAQTRQEVYRHPLYKEPDLRIQPSTTPGYAAEVIYESEVYERFTSRQQAQRWVDFMQGRLLRLQ
jgi:hypothetical protein